MNGLFVTGTDTGVGKTTVSRALVSAWAARGLRVGVCKPCETGGGDDAELLLAASARTDLPLSHVRPFAFPLPASPEAAARADGTTLEPEALVAAVRRVAASSDFTLVEGAGGLLVPFAPGFTMADLARALDVPLLIVARASLGTINHTLLTVEAARRRGLRIAGVVLNPIGATGAPDEATNAADIARHGDIRIFGTFPAVDAAAILQASQPRAA